MIQTPQPQRSTREKLLSDKRSNTHNHRLQRHSESLHRTQNLIHKKYQELPLQGTQTMDHLLQPLRQASKPPSLRQDLPHRRSIEEIQDLQLLPPSLPPGLRLLTAARKPLIKSCIILNPSARESDPRYYFISCLNHILFSLFMFLKYVDLGFSLLLIFYKYSCVLYSQKCFL